VYGYDLLALAAAGDVVVEQLGQVEGVRDVRTSAVPGSPEIRVTFDRDKLNRLGLTLSGVGATVQSKVRGAVASQFRDQERHIDIRVQNEPDQRNTLAAIQELIIAEREGVPIRLGTIASFEVVQSPAEIHRLGRQRVALVTANLAGRDLGSASAEIQERLASERLVREEIERIRERRTK
jgi:HAE1 family hydrophobic/amphiphilic exporter-1